MTAGAELLTRARDVTAIRWTRNGRDSVIHAAPVHPADVRVGQFPLACGNWAPDGFDVDAITAVDTPPTCRRCAAAWRTWADTPPAGTAAAKLEDTADAWGIVWADGCLSHWGGQPTRQQAQDILDTLRLEGASVVPLIGRDRPITAPGQSPDWMAAHTHMAPRPLWLAQTCPHGHDHAGGHDG